MSNSVPADAIRKRRLGWAVVSFWIMASVAVGFVVLLGSDILRREGTAEGGSGERIAGAVRRITPSEEPHGWDGIAVVGDSQPRKYVNLNAPGELDRVRATNPAHYETISRMLEGPRCPVGRESQQWIQRWYGVKDVLCSHFLLTSEPPQRRLSFTLDDTRYDSVVTFGSAVVIFPSKQR